MPKHNPSKKWSLVEFCVGSFFSLFFSALFLPPVIWFIFVVSGSGAIYSPSSSHDVSLGVDSVLAKETVVVRDIGYEVHSKVGRYFVTWNDSSPDTILISEEEANALQKGDSMGIVWVPAHFTSGRVPLLQPLPGVSVTREMLLEARQINDYRLFLLWLALLGITLWRTGAQRSRMEKRLFAALALGLLGMAVNFFWRSYTTSTGTVIQLVAGLSYLELSWVAWRHARTDRGWDFEPYFPDEGPWMQTRSIQVFCWHVVLLLGALLLGLFLIIVGEPDLSIIFWVYFLASPITSLIVVIVCLLDLRAGRREARIPLLLCVVYAVGSLSFLITAWPSWMGV